MSQKKLIGLITITEKNETICITRMQCFFVADDENENFRQQKLLT